MFNETLKKMISNAIFKKEMIKKDFPRYFVMAMLAGIYVGMAMFFVLSIAAPFHAVGSPATKMIIGANFTVGLTLVIFAGAELFTGTTMYMTVGALAGETTWKDALVVWSVCFLGNLVGGLLLVGVLKLSGLLDNKVTLDYINYYAHNKMNASEIQLFFRAILCNIMVCLCIWMCSRTKEDIAKLIIIFLALFAFVSSGYEHCVANMSLLAMSLVSEHGPDITIVGYIKNLTYVTLGNIVGGGFCVGAVYWYVSGPHTDKLQNK